MDREQNGNFAKGNKLSVGNKGHGRVSTTTEKIYLKSMYHVVSVEDWEEITLFAVSQAKDGNAKARDWLSRYLLPRPNDAALVQTEGVELRLIVPNLIDLDAESERLDDAED